MGITIRTLSFNFGRKLCCSSVQLQSSSRNQSSVVVGAIAMKRAYTYSDDNDNDQEESPPMKQQRIRLIHSTLNVENSLPNENIENENQDPLLVMPPTVDGDDVQAVPKNKNEISLSPYLKERRDGL